MADTKRTDGSGGQKGNPWPADAPPIALRHLDDGASVSVHSLARDIATAEENETAPPPPLTPGRIRKVALIGSAESIASAPWYDLSWEIWAHATCHSLCKRVDRYFDPHPWKWILDKNNKPYEHWLKTQTVPIYMADRRKVDVPASIKYPLNRIRAEYPLPFGSTTSYMIALALSEGVSHIGFFGIHYSVDTEYFDQRPNAEMWAGIAFGKGVQLVIPPNSPFCHEPKTLYGYDTHSGPNAQDRWKRRQVHRVDSAIDPRVVKEITLEEAMASQRDDMSFGKNIENLRRQATGLPALLPNGQPAW